MQVRCPHCQTAVELEDSTSLANLTCRSCGSHLDLLGEATIAHDECTDISLTAPTFRKSIGHFELLEPLGRGAFGAVWKAHDTHLDRMVAVKFPRKDQLSSLEAEQFFREARAAAQLKHRHIVSVHEVGREDGLSYIVSDFVDGSTLSRWRRTRTVSPNQAAEVCAKIADALHHAHECGIIHRDVKPSNVMIDEDGDPHVMDFGLAKRDSGEQQTMAVEGHAFGTPSYMSPEQARGEAKSADRRSDLYSLGVILFQLLTSELPFRGSARVIVQQVIQDDPPHAHALNRSVPTDLDTICWKLMEKLPQRRYESGQEVADELRRFLKGVPIHARPITQMERCWRWYGRNRMVGSLALAFAIAILLGIFGVTTQWIRAEKHAIAADDAARQARGAALREKQARSDAEHFLYVARMNTAQQAFELRDLERVQNILESYSGPFAEGHDPRGFEWFYWARQSKRWRHRFIGHEAPVLAVDVSPEGRWIVSSSHDGSIRIWDATRAQKPRIIQAHDQSIYALALAPDGKTIASGSRDRTIRIWEFDTGRLKKEWQAHEGTVFSLAYSKDGAKLVSGGSDTLVKLWDVRTGTPDLEFSGHEDFVYAVDLSRDGKLVASCGLDRSVRLWDATSGEPIKTLHGHLLEVWDVCFSPDTSLLASASADKTIRVWDVASRQLQETLEGHVGRVRALDFSPSSDLLVSVGNDRTVRTWDLTIENSPLRVPRRDLTRSPNHFFERMELPKGKQSFLHVGHTGPVSCVAFGDDGSTIVSAGDDMSVVSWQFSEFAEKRQFKQHAATINCAVYSKDGTMLATGSNDRTVRLWNPISGAPIGEPLVHQNSVYSVSISPDQERLVCGTSDGTITLWDRADRTKVELKGHRRSVSKVVFSHDGKRIASAGHDRTVRLWDVAGQKELSVMKGHEDRVLNVVFTGNGSTLASAGKDHTIRIWDTKTNDQIHQLDGHSDTIWAMGVHGNLLATGGADRLIRIWDLSENRVLQTLRGHGDLVLSLTFSPDGKTIASGSGDKTIRLWDVKTGESKTTLKGHKYRVWSVAFDPTGSTLVSSSYDLRFWRGLPRSLTKSAPQEEPVIDP